ncbi:MAG: hypothetical protein FWD71_03755 [Oscillospiraceae bacterium]|nr:hypothetical protein [Oscillospiraceae bacterium]
MNNIKKFDERQLWIRGNIFKHMFFTMGALVMLNAFLASLDIIWADGFYMNLLIFFAAIAAGSVEMIFRDVYITRPMQQRIIMAVMLLIGLFIFVVHIWQLFYGEPILVSGVLTDNGGSLIMSVLVLAIGVSLAVKLLRDKFKKDREF